MENFFRNPKTNVEEDLGDPPSFHTLKEKGYGNVAQSLHLPECNLYTQKCFHLL